MKTFISNDDLGLVYLDSTDGSGTTSGSITPGSWNVELNHTEVDLVILIESIELLDGGLIPGDNGLIEIVASTYYMFSGDVFWDHNDDNDSDVGEGVPEVNILMSSDQDNLSRTSLILVVNGVFVPAGTTWQIFTNRTGFAEEITSISMDSPIL